MPKAHPSRIRRGIFIEPYRTDRGRQVAAAYSHEGTKVAEAVLPDESDATWTVVHASLMVILNLHSQPLHLLS